MSSDNDDEPFPEDPADILAFQLITTPRDEVTFARVLDMYEAGANLNYYRSGITFLFLLVHTRNLQNPEIKRIILFLLEHGADPRLGPRSRTGKDAPTPIDMILREKDPELISAIRHYLPC